GNSDNVTLSWQAPTQNADGTPLMNLQGYEIHYGKASQSYTETVKIANPGVTDYVVQNLAPGKYYFALTAYNSAGVQSSLSGEVSTVINN
ncbi:MAG: fibronectin type III domain-containing protein, partial [Sinobacteraceae bacterium]|nr:fibronectin type III domain-containing protein [Nevskiaceae bacterium]